MDATTGSTKPIEDDVEVTSNLQHSKTMNFSSRSGSPAINILPLCCCRRDVLGDTLTRSGQDEKSHGYRNTLENAGAPYLHVDLHKTVPGNFNFSSNAPGQGVPSSCANFR